MFFLRPEWFLMLVPTVILAVWYWRRKRGSYSWAAVIDPLLLPHLLIEQKGRRAMWPFVLSLLVGLLVILALAGPAWQKLSQPVFKQQSALIIALDLSVSMNADDIKPSRLERVRLKLTDLLKQRKEGQTALIVYAGTAYTVTPLTDDFQTILSLLPSLSTDMMPAQGSRADLAVSRATELFDNAGMKRGDILLITDGVYGQSLQNLNNWHVPGFRLSILAVGSESGAPIPSSEGGFVKNSAGEIVITRANRQQMRTLASEKAGLYVDLRIDDNDIQAILDLVNGQSRLSDHKQAEFKADRWQEEGPWLLLLVTPLAALAFRRGIFLTLFIALLLAQAPQPVLAEASLWERLWNNKEQLASKALQQGDARTASNLFKPGDWKAAAHYRAGEFEEAYQQLESTQTIAGQYNRANTLANMGKLEEALQQYDKVLEQDPEHEDAAYNRGLVEQAMRQQEQQQSQDGDQSKEEQQKQEQQKDQQQQDQQKGDQQQDQQQGEQQEQDQQQGQSGEQQKQDQAQGSEQRNQDQDSQQKDDDQALQQQAEKDRKKNQKNEGNQQQQNDQNSDEQESLQAEQLKPEESEEESRMGNRRDKEKNADQLLSEQVEEQWLRRIDDDPGGLLRNKFRYQYGLQSQPPPESEQW